jgi:hypothetical protein
MERAIILYSSCYYLVEQHIRIPYKKLHALLISSHAFPKIIKIRVNVVNVLWDGLDLIAIFLYALLRVFLELVRLQIRVNVSQDGQDQSVVLEYALNVCMAYALLQRSANVFMALLGLAVIFQSVILHVCTATQFYQISVNVSLGGQVLSVIFLNALKDVDMDIVLTHKFANASLDISHLIILTVNVMRLIVKHMILSVFIATLINAQNVITNTYWILPLSNATLVKICTSHYVLLVIIKLAKNAFGLINIILLQNHVLQTDRLNFLSLYFL